MSDEQNTGEQDPTAEVWEREQERADEAAKQRDADAKQAEKEAKDAEKAAQKK